jgi:hypothetical protein
MAFAGMDNQQTGPPRGGQERLGWRNGPAKQADIVAEDCTKTTRLEEIALHVND